MMRPLAISCFLVLLFASCSLPTTEGLRQVQSNTVEVANPYFSDPSLDYIYKAKIEVYKKNFGGVLIIKKTGPESHRVVFTTEFGSKLFDFQFEEDTFTKHFIVDDLDKKFIVNILKDDFRLLVTEKAKVSGVFQAENQRIYKTTDGDRFNFYFLNHDPERLEKIVNTTKKKEKVEIGFTSHERNIADLISIKHKNIKLTIALEKFKKE